MKKAISVLLCFCLALSVVTTLSFTASAATELESVGSDSGTTGDCTWTLDDDGVLTISGNGAMEDYHPWTPWTGNVTSVNINDGVTSIGECAFWNCTLLTNVTIPDSVTSIGGDAFGGCTGLTSITIPDSVTSIGSYAFENCTGLTSVTIPDSVTSIGDSAFYKCTGLTSVTIPDSVTSIGDSAFSACTGLSSVYITDIAAWCGIDFRKSYDHNMLSNPLYYAHHLYLNNELVTNLVLPDSVTSIGNYAFYGFTGLTSITIPDSVTSIGDSAFEECENLTDVTIGNGVTYIGSSAFADTSVSGGMTGDCAWWLYNGVLTINGNGAMKNYSYDSTLPWGKNIISIVINDGVTSIGNYAFSGCTELTSVTIGNSVTSIGGTAFKDCTNLTSLSIPASVTSIGTNVLTGCTNKDLVIFCESDSVGERYAKAEAIPVIVYESIEDGCAYRLTAYPENKTEVVIPATFAGKPVTALGKWLFKYNSKIESVTIADSVTEIPRGAFYNCTELKTVTMGNNVTEIGESAFEKCLFLEQINLSSKLKTIGDEAFYDCRRLKQLNLPNTLTTIGEEAFTNCRSLTELVIPKGVQNLGNEESVGFGMFENCKNLKEITIPESVGYIQDNAFDGCGQVTIRAKVNSYAAQYADANQLAFSKIDSEPVGDANGDSKINVRDVTSIQRFVGEFVQFTDEQLAAADVDGNGIVDINDATYLQMYLAEYDVTLG